MNRSRYLLLLNTKIELKLSFIAYIFINAQVYGN